VIINKQYSRHRPSNSLFLGLPERFEAPKFTSASRADAVLRWMAIWLLTMANVAFMRTLVILFFRTLLE
jgi:hypothetical protein